MFSYFIFPDEVAINRRSILFRPMRVLDRVDGSIQKWQAGSIPLDENSPENGHFLKSNWRRSVLICSYVSRVRRRGSYRLEDQGTKETQLDLPICEIALHKKNAQYCYHYPGTWGKRDAGTVLAKEFVISVPLRGQYKNI